MRSAFQSLLFASLVLATSAVANRAQTANPLCPSVTVTGPAMVTMPGDTLTFTVSVSSNATTVKYTWTVSPGAIEYGQGTPSIIVRSSRAEAGMTIEAKVSVEGLPGGCRADASESAPIENVPTCGMPVDEFGNLKPNDIRGRLDNFFYELMNNPAHVGIILFRISEKEKLDKTNPRLQFILRHAKFRKFDVERLIFKFEPSDEATTKLYRFPQDVESICPECTTVYGRELK